MFCKSGGVVKYFFHAVCVVCCVWLNMVVKVCKGVPRCVEVKAGVGGVGV